ncbi:MAG: carboxy-S-adenosyl-L-methionine synthase CmoA [Planctomycetaceae bacterium]
MTDRDEIFQSKGRVSDFVFDEEVARVFDDMVARSVPFYAEIQRMQADLAVDFLPEAALVYDLGCSTGTTIDLLARHPRCPRGVRFLGVDNAPSMLEHASRKLAGPLAEGRVILRNADLDAGIELESCQLVLLNWTLQFVRPLHRERLLTRIAAALRPGGALLLSEKVLPASSRLNRAYIELYHRYKQERGYTEGEIVRKREALENVLVPYRIEENMEMLARAGFAAVDAYFRWFNFACFVAVKGG